jgi:hypothetical protein
MCFQTLVVVNNSFLKNSACFTGCSACTSNTVSTCSACQAGYVLASTYCCPTATSKLQGTVCQANCNSGFFSLNNVCTGNWLILKK